MQEIIDTISYAGQTISALIFAFMAIYGLLECFFGFKLMKLAFAICGFLFGGLLGAAIASLGLDISNPGVSTLIGIICGILGAYLLFKIYLLGVFLSHGAMTMLLGVLLAGTSETALWLSGICAVLVGILAVKFVRVWVIYTTGVTGGMMAGGALLGMLDVHNQAFAYVLGAVLAALGILYQWKTTAKYFPAQAKAAPTAATAAPAAPVAPVPVAPAAPVVPMAAEAVTVGPVAASAPAVSQPALWAQKTAPKARKQEAEMPDFLKKALQEMQ